MIYKRVEAATLRPLAYFSVFTISLIVAGTAGYVVIEGWSIGDAFYMVVITLSTVGFGEVQPLSPGGKIFTAILILAGVGGLGYLIGLIGQHLISGTLTGTFWSRHMQRKIDDMRDHYIVCGYGRVGRQVVHDLEQRGCRTVVIELEERRLEESAHAHPYVLGDAADDGVLKNAGIERAKGLVVATGDDAINLFVTLSARALNAKLEIIARANQPSTEPKLKRAGATHVTSPYVISGHRIATQLLYPSVGAFLDEVLHSGDLELWLEEIQVGAESPMEDKTIDVIRPQKQTGATVIAVRGAGGHGFATANLAHLTIHSGDILIALGTSEQLGALARLAGSLPRQADQARKH